MLKIRLKRVGRKHDPSFRVVLVDSRRGPKTGKVIEILGFYDARRDVRELKGEEIKKRILEGAQVSDTVHNLLVTEKVINDKKINVLPKKTPIIKAEDASERAEGAESSSDDSVDDSIKEETSTEESKEESSAEEAKEESLLESEENTSEETPTEEAKEKPEEEPAPEASLEKEKTE